MVQSKSPVRGQAYDFIFMGAGCAALSIVMRMIKTARFADKKILLIDKERKINNDRTWCFWEKDDGFFENVVYRKWDKLCFFSNDFSDLMDISPYEYKMIRGIDFYNYCFSEIAKNINIDILYGKIGSISYDRDGISIDIDDVTQRFQHATLFNSFPKDQKQDRVNSKNDITFLQHFKGWIIDTPHAVFDPGKATFMDFRVRQDRGTTFVYVLPFSATRALVEYTLFTKDILKDEEYDSELSAYLKEFLKIADYKIIEEEFGVIPMTTRKFNFYTGKTYNIGTAGGQTKASSGYTFQFIQKQARLITECLLSPHKGLSEIPGTPNRFLFYDKVLLDVLHNERATGKEVFTTLFKKNEPQQVLKFMDNETSFTEELKIISSLPTFPFLRAAFKQF
jgi:lycopene beta-cyclase